MHSSMVPFNKGEKMQKLVRSILLISIMLAMSTYMSAFIGKKTFFAIRSQGLNGVREHAGWDRQMYKSDSGDSHGVVSATVEYSRSFKPKDIAEFLFGGTSLTFSGSRVIDRRSTDILADYFGLPADFSSVVNLTPHVSNVVLDLNWFHAFDNYVSGLYCMFHVPIVHTKWEPYFSEVAVKSGSAFHPAGYMSSARIVRSDLATNITQALQGSTTFGDMQEPLKFGKFFGRQTSSKVAEFQITIGWNYNQDWYHVGVNGWVGAPTGTLPASEFIFESIVGNGHHWQIGGGISGHVCFWENEGETKRWAFYVDAQIAHLTASKQKRSFDLKNNGVGSRYILLETIDRPVIQGLLINGTPPVNQYIGRLIPAINVTTLKSKISMDVEADVVAKIAYQKNNFEIDFGYNFWGRSEEKLHGRDMLVENKFGLKGDAQLYGFTAQNAAVALNATQSKATIFKGQGQGNANFTNTNADNQPALASTAAGILNQLNAADSATVANGGLGIVQAQVNGSNPAILLKDSDINEDSALLPRAISHKIFTYFNYAWDNKEEISPYLGGGLSSEWAHTDAAKNSGMSQWAIWIKGGLSY